MATIRGMLYHWAVADNSNIFGGEATKTVQINFGRTGAVARTTVSTVGKGGGYCAGGITQFRTRPEPNGADVETNVDLYLGSPFVPIVAEDNMTSVTAVISTIFVAGVINLTVDFWG